MSKTVFGMPGAGQGSKGGDAVAPGGVPGTGATGHLAQKSGKTEAFSPMQPQAKPASKPAAPLPAAPPAPAPKPAMATPMAKLEPTAPAAPGAAGGSANKTMFGMPAMKLPVSGQPATAPKPQPAGIPPATAAATPEAPDAPQDAFMPTQLGMAPLSAEEAAATAMPSEPAPDPAPVVRSPAAQAPRSVRMPMEEETEYSPGPSKGLLIGIIAGAALIFIAAALTVFFMFIKPKMFPSAAPPAAMHSQMPAPGSVPTPDLNAEPTPAPPVPVPPPAQ